MEKPILKRSEFDWISEKAFMSPIIVKKGEVNVDPQYLVPLHNLTGEVFKFDEQTGYMVPVLNQSLWVRPQIINSIPNTLPDGNVLNQRRFIMCPQTEHSQPTNPQPSNKQVHNVSEDTKQSKPCIIVSSNDSKESTDSNLEDFQWSPVLHQYFLSCIFEIGLKFAKPLNVLKQMRSCVNLMLALKNIEPMKFNTLTSVHVKGHLQRYRGNVVCVRRAFTVEVVMGLEANLLYHHSDLSLEAKASEAKTLDEPALDAKRVRITQDTNLAYKAPEKRFYWSDELHQLFLASIFKLGLDHASAPLVFRTMSANLDFATGVRSSHAVVKTLISKLQLRHVKLHLTHIQEESTGFIDSFIKQLSKIMTTAKFKQKDIPKKHPFHPEYHSYPFAANMTFPSG